jgi:4-hydroxybutyrate CoA-transferase
MNNREGMNWRDEYRRKLISAEDAAKLVKTGDKVLLGFRPEPAALGLALAARREEVELVEITVQAPEIDFGWYDPGWEGQFRVKLLWSAAISRPILSTGLADYLPHMCPLIFKPQREGRVGAKTWDVLMLSLSPPDQNGFCSFGHNLWWKKEAIKWSKTVIAEVMPGLVRTYGENFVHVSEIDYFVDNPSGALQPMYEWTGELPEGSKTIAEYVSTLINDGDTIQTGGGLVTLALAKLGAFDKKNDLGFHTEFLLDGGVDLVRRGIVTGKRKNFHHGKVVTTSLHPTDLDYVDMNPMFELYPSSFTNDPRNIAANDNMVALNQALAIDLTGQVAAESLGYQVWAGTGGQFDFAVGAMLSKGGRNIVILPSTARKGTVSRIVPAFEPGTIISVPRFMSDYVVTEYGIANLTGKSERERAEELIVVAHPDFHNELRNEAKKWGRQNR